MLELSKGTVDRARSGAEFVEKAAAAVATVYVGILGAAFSVSDNPLPLRGLIPAVFLGLAIAGAAYYLAYPAGQSVSTMTTPDDHASIEEWTNTFTEITRRMAFRRGWALRAGIVSLAFGALFLPTPFIKVRTTPPKPPAEIAWPKVPSANTALERILFTEQVQEIARLRSEAKPTPAGQRKVRELYVWWAAAGALALVALTALLTVLSAWWAGRAATPPPDKGRVSVPRGRRRPS
jgi:hypothetical protein